MPVSYTIQDGFILYVGTGVVTDDELLGAARRLRADHRLTAGLPILSDMSGCSDLKVTEEGMALLIAERRAAAEQRGTARTALCAWNRLEYGLASRFREMSEGDESDVEVQVFRNIATARAWLGV